MFNKIIAPITALFTIIGGYFSALADAILFPSYEMTDSIRFGQSLGQGWNLGNTMEACEKFSAEKAGLETETMWGNPETTKELIEYLKAKRLYVNEITEESEDM